MPRIIDGKTMFDLVSDFEMNNDCLRLLQQTIEDNEGKVPDGFCHLLESVTVKYEKLTKGFYGLSRI